jgi:CRISPR-associated protein Cas2
MRGQSLRYLICYDVPDTSRRTRLARCLDGYGARVQWSVFEAVLDPALHEAMLYDIGRIILPEEDNVIVYPLCAACDRKRTELGTAVGKVRPGEELVFIV